jgi:hypothetical protein
MRLPLVPTQASRRRKRREIAAERLEAVSFAIDLVLRPNTDAAEERQERIPPVRLQPHASEAALPYPGDR